MTTVLAKKVLVDDNCFTGNLDIVNLDLNNAEFTSGNVNCYACYNLVTLSNFNQNITRVNVTYCRNLSSISNIPFTVTNLHFAFSNCTNLGGNINIDTPFLELSQCMFNNTSKTKNVYIPYGNTSTYNYFNTWHGNGANGVILREHTGYANYNSNWYYFKPDTIVRYIGSETDVTIPNSINDNISYVYYPEMFNNCQSIVNVNIENGRTNHSLMYRTFYNCTNLKTIEGNIPENITNIQEAFYNCQNLIASPIIPSGVVSMSNVFNNCTNLTTPPVIPNSVTNLFGAFYNCTNLTTTPVIPNSVVNIGHVFRNCYNLTTFPNLSGLNPNTYIGGMFWGCSNMSGTPSLPNEIYSGSGVSGPFGRLFDGCSNMSGTIGLNIIGNKNSELYFMRTFSGCSNISKVYINTNGVNIPIRFQQPFPLCNNISDIYIEPGYSRYGVSSLGFPTDHDINIYVQPHSTVYNGLMNYYSSYENIHIYPHPNYAETSDWLYYNSTYKLLKHIGSTNDVVIPESINGHNTSIDISGFFSYNNTVTSVVAEDGIKDTFTNLANTFNNCSNLISTNIIGNNVNILFNTFQNCTNLVDVGVLPDSLDTLWYAFAGCSNLINNFPTIPNSVTNLCGLFANQISWETVPQNAINIWNNLPEHLKNSMSYIFYGCYNLKSLPEIPQGVADLSWAFTSCSNVKTFPTIPNSVTNMYYTFSYCYNMVDAPFIPNSVVNMQGTFAYCQNLINVYNIPEGVTTLNDTFWYCYNLAHIPNIPSTVTSLSRAFMYDRNLTGNIYIKSENVTAAGGCFAWTTNNGSTPITRNKNVYIPFKYANGEYTKTYNSFIRAGYDTSGTTNGVYLKDINQI